jgi:hypothetical protein
LYGFDNRSGVGRDSNVPFPTAKGYHFEVIVGFVVGPVISTFGRIKVIFELEDLAVDPTVSFTDDIDCKAIIVICITTSCEFDRNSPVFI